MTSQHEFSQLLNPESRRQFFQVAAKVFGAGAAAGILHGQVTTPPTGGTDVDVLNYALTLEQLEAGFYTAFLGQTNNTGTGTGGTGTGGTGTGGTGTGGTGTGGTGTTPPGFTIDDVQNSSLITIGGSALFGNIFSQLEAIRDHELAHVDAITATIRSLGGTPVQPCTYNFPATASFDTFLSLARTLENVGVSAYTGAINRIQSPSLRQTAATIATVEARHAAFLNLLAGGALTDAGMIGGSAGTNNATVPGVSSSPFPSAFDTPLQQSQVLSLASGFLVSCSTPLPTPPVTATVTPNNTTVTANSVNLAATIDASVGMPRSISYRVLPGSLRPSILQTANSPNATIQFVSGVGRYLLELVVTDANGNVTTTPITLTYQP